MIITVKDALNAAPCEKKPEQKKNTTKTKTTTKKKDVNPHTFAMPVQRSNQLRILGILIINYILQLH